MWKVCNYYIQGPDQGGNSTRWMYHNDHNGYYLTCVRYDYALIVGSGELAAMVALAKEFTSLGHQNVQVMYVPSGKIYNQFGEITPAPMLTVSKITTIQTSTTPDASGHYNVKIEVTTTGTGTFQVTVDGNEIHREDVTNATNKIYTYNWGFKLKSTSYNICADVI